ncbi:MAG: class II aldolase/adducin family protein [Dehalococcoidales bacterium]|nr:class II aldolase/adducin family protein [Dehalococcoidales bacterium]
MGQWRQEKKIVLEAAQKMLEKGLVVGTAGNISLRLPPEGERQLLAITPSARHYDLLGADDIQIVDFNGQTVEGNLPPSMETMLHIGIYRARKNVNAVIHTHSVFASAVSVTGRDIPPILDDQIAFLGGGIKLARHTLSGSREQVANVVAALGDRNAVLLPNHGAIGTGRTMRDAFTACELIEKTARIYLLALSTGTVNHLPAKAIEVEKALYDRLQKESD